MGTKNKLFDFGKGWQWVLLIVGLIMLLISVCFLDCQKAWWWFLSNRIGEVLIIGSLIGFLSSHQTVISGYRKELNELFFDGRVICKRTDISVVWDTVSKQLFKSKFPNIHAKLIPLIREGYLPTNEISYYSAYEDTINLSWSDEARGDLFVEHNTQFTLFAESTKLILFEQSNWIKVPCLESYDQCCDICMIIDGQEQTKITRKYDEVKGRLETKIIAELKGKTEYQVIKKTKKRYNINDDYHIAFRAKYMTDQISVTLSLPENIEHVFIECGAKQDFALNKTGAIWKYQYKNLLLPRQGYIIILKPILKE